MVYESTSKMQVKDSRLRLTRQNRLWKGLIGALISSWQIPSHVRNLLEGFPLKTSKKEFKTIDEYIAIFPKNIQATLQEMRQGVKEAAPQAEEVISYQMPAFKQNGILVYFAALKNHISFFPTSSGVAAFKEELAGCVTSKGTVQFPLDKPLPIELVKRIVRFRVKENLSNKK